MAQQMRAIGLRSDVAQGRPNRLAATRAGQRSDTCGVEDTFTRHAHSSSAGPTPSFAEATLPAGLASHQLEALAWLVDRPVALIADATGSGKTAVAAAAIAYAFDVEGADRAIWVTEANLIEQTCRELRRFLPAMVVNAWPGLSDDQVRVVSVETLTRHVDLVIAWAAHVAVVDEASGVKGTGPEPRAVRRVLSSAGRRLALTATPVELDATEAYRILRLLGAPDLPPVAVFDSFLEWQDLPFGESRPLATRPEAIAQVRSVFARYVLRRDVGELGLVLPALTEVTEWVELTPPQQLAYEWAGGEQSPLAQASKREKACAFAAGRSAKAETAVRWILAHPEVAKMVLFAENLAHLDIVERLLDRVGIGWARIDGPRSRQQRTTAVETFKCDPNCRVLLGTKVLERGLDGLQFCGVMLSLGSTFNPAREQQRIGRLRRPGSPHQTVIHVTFASSTTHEINKHRTLERRRLEACALIEGLPTPLTKEIEMDLSEFQLQSLERTRPWLPRTRPAHGTPLAEAVTTADEMEYLSAAVRAGHLPDFDGIEFALAAYFVYVNQEMRKEIEAGAHHSAAGWTLMSREYRKLAASLIAEADHLDAQAAALHQRSAGTA